MAIYYPQLFCEKGQPLIAKKSIIYDDKTVVSEGEQGYVKDIVGYGFDIIMDSGFELRLMNSQMSDFFEKSTTKGKSGIRLSVPTTVDMIFFDLVGNVDVQKLISTQNIIMFSSDFTIKSADITFYTGEKFFYEEDDGYYNLYDVNTYRKVLRMSEKEVKQYCQLQATPIEELV